MARQHLKDRFEEEAIARFKALQVQHGPDANACLLWMLDVCEHAKSKPEPKSAMVTDEDRAQWVGRDLSDPRQRRGKLPGVSFVHCRNILDKLIAANHATVQREHRRYISRNVLEEESGVSPTISKKFWDANLEEITNHNKDMGFATPKEGQIHNQWHYRPVHDNGRIPSEKTTV
jgi:hypothetical protein